MPLSPAQILSLPELPDYQQYIASDEIEPGDYLYRSVETPLSGPRGGRYVVRESSIMARVKAFDETGELLLSDGGRALMPMRLRYRNVPVVIKRRV